MLQILKEYQKRLINLSSRNMSLVMNKPYKKRSYDLLSVDQLVKGYSDRIIEDLISGKEKIEIAPNPQKWIQLENKKLDTLLKNMEADIVKSYDLKLSEFKSHKSTAGRELYSLLMKLDMTEVSDRSAFLDEMRHYYRVGIQKQYEELQRLSKGLDYLNREIELEQKETGISNLYVGYYFIEGKFEDGSPCRAPLCLLPVSIEKDKGTWYLYNQSKSEFEINKVFALSAIKNNEIKTKKTLEFEYNFGSELSLQFLKFYKDFGINIASSVQKFEKLPTYSTKVSYDEYNRGDLQLKGHLILGRFPTSNAIYEDYEEMINNQLSNQLVDVLVSGVEKEQIDENEFEYDSDTDESSRDLHESNHFFISDLDYSQELAVKKLEDTHATVCFGPPGTGKSQTLTNIVSDALAKGKRVLVVSQKRAALDVIYNRLSGIHSKLALIHDAEKGKKEFYGRINDLLSHYEEKYGNEFHYTNRVSRVKTNHAHTKGKISKVANTIEDNLDNYRFLNTGLYKKWENGETLRRMCNLAWSREALTNSQHELLNHYYNIKNSLPEFGYSYNELVEHTDTIVQEDVVSVVKKFDVLLEETSLFSQVIDEPDFFVFHDLEGKHKELEEILNKLIESYQDPDYKRMYDIYQQVKNEEEAIRLSQKEISEKYGDLLLPIATGVKRLVKLIFRHKELRFEEEERKNKYLALVEENRADLIDLNQKYNQATKLLNEFRRILNHESVDKMAEVAFNRFGIVDWSEFDCIRKYYMDYLRLKDRLGQYPSIDIEFIRVVCESIDDLDSQRKFIANYPQISMYDYISNRLMYSSDVRKLLAIIEGYSESTLHTRLMMQTKAELTEKYIIEFWDERFTDAAKEERNFGDFRHIVGLKRRLRPLRVFMSTYSKVLLSLFPCYLMGPETVSNILPLKEGMFDIIIYDEASQMFVEEALPSLYRAKKVIVAGDDKQLKPSGLFKKTMSVQNEDDFEDEEGDVNVAAIEVESLLDLAKNTYRPSYLNFHYRSQFAELINFSNYAFYGGKLKLSPNVQRSEEIKPIIRIKVDDATWENRCNVEEAERVIKVLKHILVHRSDDETIGIITFNVSQMDKIYDLMEIEIEKDPEFKSSILRERNRKNGDEDVSIFVKNIENVQGDERDIIIFSTGYTYRTNGRLVQQFGSLSQSGGENRLNVAITRAKKQVIVITSFEPEDLNVDNAKQLGPLLFKQYLRYVKAISSGDKGTVNSVLNSLLDINIGRTSVDSFDSPFEEEVFEELINMGYKIDTQVGVSGYSIDLGVYDPVTSSYVLGIECDGRSYHSSPSARERDIHRQKFLESRGWKIYRIWSTDWWSNKETVLEELKNKIESSIIRLRENTGTFSSLHFQVDLTSTTEELTESIEDLQTISKTEQQELDIDRSDCEEETVTYGDKVILLADEGDTFEIEVERNKYNRHLMSEIEILILGMEKDKKFRFKGNAYTIIEILK